MITKTFITICQQSFITEQEEFTTPQIQITHLKKMSCITHNIKSTTVTL